ncbi:MAG: FHA domain-containing protein [Persicimonas sp.]
MAVKMTIHPPREASTRVVEFDEDRVTIGRSSQCDLRLPLRVVSGQHLVIEREATHTYQVRDVNSTNGTLLDGEPMEAERPYPLTTAGRLEIVDLRIDLEVVPSIGEGIPLEKTGTMVRQMVGEAFLTADKHSEECAYFEVLNGPHSGRRFELRDDLEEGILSSDPDATFSLPETSVTLRIFRDGDGFGIAPAGDPSGEAVTVEKQPLDSRRRLASGEVVDVEGTRLRFVDPLESYLEELDGVMPREETPEEESDGEAASTTGALEEERPLGTETVEASETDETDGPKSSAETSQTEASGLGKLEVVVIAITTVLVVGVAFLLALIFGVI